MISEENKIKNREKIMQKYRDQFIGTKYGMLTILDFIGYKDKKSTIICKTKCDCGNYKDVIFISLKRSNTTSCGCKMFTDIEKFISEKTKEYVGKKISRLTIIKILGYQNGHDVSCLAKCDCGIEKNFSLYRILKGSCRSCGCLKNEGIAKRFKTHGISNHPLHQIWASIKHRCTNSNSAHYNLYGGKGVSMCKEWFNDFTKFYDWCMENGWEKGLHVDKDIKARKVLNKEGMIYSPEWCSIVTGKVNSNSKTNNRVLEIDGEKINLRQACEKYNISWSTLFNRLARGWDANKAVKTPIMRQFASR